MGRHTVRILLVALLVGGVLAVGPQASAGGDCGTLVEFRARITSGTTNQGIPGRVYFYDEDSLLYDFESNAAGRVVNCLDPGTYRFRYTALGHRGEWFDDAATGTAAELVVADTDPIVADAALTPRNGLIMGRVTRPNGTLPPFRSVSFFRATPFGWFSFEGGGTDESGWYEIDGLEPGRYAVAAFVDSHKARWATSAARLRDARIFRISATQRAYANAHIQVPFCPASVGGEWCVPPGFYT